MCAFKISTDEDRAYRFLLEAPPVGPFSGCDRSMIAAFPQILGRYTVCIKDRLSERDRGILALAKKSYEELQELFERGATVLSRQVVPLTAQFLEGFSSGQNPNALFDAIKRQAVDMPFLLFAERSDGVKDRAAELRASRSDAMRILCECLEDRYPREENTAQKATLVKLLCGAGGIPLVAAGKNVTAPLLDLLYIWAGRDQGAVASPHEQTTEKLLKYLGLNRYLPRQFNSHTFFDDIDTRVSFLDFVAACSLKVITDRLGIGLDSDLIDFFTKKFKANETFRSNLVYALAHQEEMVQIDWQDQVHLNSLKEYLLLVKKHDPLVDYRTYLLYVCMFRDPRLEILPDTNAPYSNLGEALQATMALMPENSNAHAYWVVRFLMNQSPEYVLAIRELFVSLKRNKGMQITPPAVIEFCRANQKALAHHLTALQRAYADVLGSMQEDGIQFSGAESLFIEPPIDVQKYAEALQAAEKEAKQCRLALKQAGFQFSFKGPFFGILREFLFNPVRIFDILSKDSRALGIERVDEAVIQEVLREAPVRFGDFSKIDRSMQQQYAKELRALYGFSSAQTLALYLEILSQPNFDSFQKINYWLASMHKRTGISFSQDKQWPLYTLFRHRPDIALGCEEALFQLLRAFVNRHRQRTLDQDEDLQALIPQIRTFWEDIFKGCPSEKTEMAIVGFETMTREFFRPSLQVVVDSLRHKGINPDGTLMWNDPTWLTHEGMSKKIPGTNVEIYPKWELGPEGFPVFSVTCFNVETANARCAAAVLRVDQNGLKREALYQSVLSMGEAAIGGKINVAVPKKQDHPLSSVEHDEAYRFIDEIKAGVLKAYWDLVFESPSDIPNFKLNFAQMAALGNIDQGSLIPSTLICPLEGSRFYSLEEEQQHLISPRKLLRDAVLPFSLIVTEDGQTETRVPIALTVRQPEGSDFSYITFVAGEIRDTLCLRSQILQNEVVLREHLAFRLLELKSRLYRRLISSGSIRSAQSRAPGQTDRQDSRHSSTRTSTHTQANLGSSTERKVS